MSSATEQCDGWKEIARHLNRSVRSVQRWEEREQLPVRRHQHLQGASVYAFCHELDAWWQNERHVATSAAGHEPIVQHNSFSSARTTG